MEYKENMEIDELPYCVNCGKKVPAIFPILSDQDNHDDYPCCCDKCVDELFEKIHKRKPEWTKIEEKND